MRMPSIIISINIVLEIVADAIKQGKKIKYISKSINKGRHESCHYLQMIMYVENPRVYN